MDDVSMEEIAERSHGDLPTQMTANSTGKATSTSRLQQQRANNYIVSAQKATAINAAVVGNFCRPDELDLIIARVNRLEHLLVTAEGLRPHREIPIYGRIATIIGFRLPSESLDSLLILTVKYHLAILSFDADGNVRTRASGCVADRVGRQAETGIIASVHSSGLISLRLYDGHLKLIEWKDDGDLRPFNVRFEDQDVTDVAFLDTADAGRPTVGYYYGDRNARHLKVREIDMDEKSFLPALWRQGNIETETSLLITVPQPYGGIILVGRETISYQKNANHCIAIAPPLIHRSQFNCYGRIDKTGERFLLGDLSGRLFMLLLIKEPNKDGGFNIRDLKLELLGEISIPECIVYLDNSVAFVGSRFGDSQLIRLTTEPTNAEATSFIQVLDSYPNLAPIRDLALITNEGQTQVVTCSGAFKDGSLRVIRNGIGIDVLASVELVGIKALFTLHSPQSPGVDKYLVVSFAEITHLLLVDGEEMEDIHLTNFDLSKATIWTGNMVCSEGRMLQVTSSAVHLLSDDGGFHTSWQGCATRISLCSVNAHSGQILLASGPELYYLLVKGSEIVLASQLTCSNEVACLDISPIAENSPSKAFAVGLWNSHAVELYSIEPEIRLIAEAKIAGDVLPRSLLIVSMESVIYLLIALGDGTLCYYKINEQDGSLSEQKKVTLGTQPISLRKFQSKGNVNVFACSDRPTVIYSSNHKLAFSNVNVKLVNQLAQLNSNFYRNCLAMSDGTNLIIGTIDEIQKLHIRRVPLGECVSRIAHQPATGTIAILTYRSEETLPNGERYSRPSVSTHCTSRTPQASGGTNEVSSSSSRHDQAAAVNEVHSLCILDANTMQPLCAYELSRNEVGMSICSAVLADDPTHYYAVGTSYVEAEGMESRLGRILIFQVVGASSDNSDASRQSGGGEGASKAPVDATRKLRLACEKEVKGCVFSITTLNDKLICTVNSSVRLFEWTVEKELRLECSHFNYITALFLKTKGDLVLVGDLMRSICLLSYKPVDSSFDEIARDYSTEWTTACEIVNSDTFLAAENSYNMFCCQRDANAETDEDRMRLKSVGFFYLGENVNAFRRGSLSSHHNAASALNGVSAASPLLYGTTDGALGVVVQLPDALYSFLLELQKRIATHTSNCMRIDHDTYRSYSTERRQEHWQGFIDGDLVETLIDMPREEVRKILDGLQLPHQVVQQPQNVQLDQREEQSTGRRPKPATVEEVLKMVEELSRLH